MTTPRIVYFIKPVGKPGPIKIGYSARPEKRLMMLSKWSPWPLEMIGSVPGTMKDERTIHSCFAFSHSLAGYIALYGEPEPPCVATILRFDRSKAATPTRLGDQPLSIRR